MRSTSLSPIQKQRKILPRGSFSNIVFLKKNLDRPFHQKSTDPNIANFKDMIQYKKSNKPRLNSEQMQKIDYTLKIDQKSSKAYKLRLRENNLFLNFNHNPFTHNITKQKVNPELSHKNTYRQKQKPMINLINSLQQFKNKQTFLSIDLPQKTERGKQAFLVYNGVKNKINKINRHYLSQIGNIFIQDEVPKQNNLKKIQKNTQQLRKPSQYQFLDNILTIKQDNYFHKHFQKKKINIFKIINQENHQDFFSSRQILSSYYFCIDLQSKKSLTNKKIVIHQQISSFSRISALLKTPVINHRIPLTDINIQYQNINFDDLMLICQGRMASDILFNYLNGNHKITLNSLRQQHSSVSGVMDYEVIYKQRRKDNQNNQRLQKYQKTQIGFFIQQPLTKNEQIQRQKCLNYNYNIHKLIGQNMKMIQLNVGDKKTIKQINKDKNKLLRQMIGQPSIKKVQNMKGQMQKQIRMNKLFKNRNQKIKAELVIQTIKEVKQFQKIKKHIKSTMQYGKK